MEYNRGKMTVVIRAKEKAMNKTKWYIAWGVLYAVCAGLSFISQPEGVLAGLMVVLSLLFFLPPVMLLHWAIPREKWGTVRLVRNLSMASLGLTLVVLVLNFLSVGASAAVGDVLHVLLVLVSAPMICIQAWIVSLFLWACLLMVTLKYRKR